MNNYKLPTSLNVGGVGYSIRTGWSDIVRIMEAMNDQFLSQKAKVYITLRIMYPDYKKIPTDHLQEAYEKACEFIDAGSRDDGKQKPTLIYWAQDASIIIPAVNSVAGEEIRSHPEMHWWTFLGYFMSVGESLLGSVLYIRQKKSKHKKLEKWEQEFYKENKEIIDRQTKENDEIKAEKESIMKFL